MLWLRVLPMALAATIKVPAGCATGQSPTPGLWGLLLLLAVRRSR